MRCQIETASTAAGQKRERIPDHEILIAGQRDVESREQEYVGGNWIEVSVRSGAFFRKNKSR